MYPNGAAFAARRLRRAPAGRLRAAALAEAAACAVVRAPRRDQRLQHRSAESQPDGRRAEVQRGHSNDFVGRYKQTLVRNEETADGYFRRNTKRWQKSRDNYITNLGNAQSQRATALGDQFCRLTQGEMDEVLALSGLADLPGYAELKDTVGPASDAV